MADVRFIRKNGRIIPISSRGPQWKNTGVVVQNKGVKYTAQSKPNNFESRAIEGAKRGGFAGGLFGVGISAMEAFSTKRISIKGTARVIGGTAMIGAAVGSGVRGVFGFGKDYRWVKSKAK